MGKLFLAGKPTDELSVLLEAGDDCKAVMDLILGGHLWTTDEGLAHYRVQLRERSRLRQLRELGAGCPSPTPQPGRRPSWPSSTAP